ncbi:MAG TPA: hypothetical protein VEJ86_08815 [Candidatus Binataceae bacterium]|nr:hypothetical protein [Candidatus Binataceae bacterium]
MKRALALLAATLLALALGACDPNRGMDFGPVGETNAAPTDQLSRDILRDFNGHDFALGANDRAAEVRLTSWPPSRHILIPFWLGVNPLYPGFLRPTVGHIYVMSESIMVRALNNSEYLIRAGSKLFKTDTLFEATHTHYAGTGKMLPTVVRFVGTRVVTVPADPPSTSTITEKVPVLREVSLPMHVDEPLAGYASFEVRKNPA